MKIRNGFVSNSSSSSFVLMSTTENFEKAKENLSPYEKAVINQITEKGNLFGKDIAYIGDLNPMDYSYTFEDFSLDEITEEIENDPLSEENDCYEACYHFQNELERIAGKDEIFNWEM